MLIHVPEVGTPCLQREECGEILRPQERKTPIVDLWRKHARECSLGCKAPPPNAAYLKLTRLGV